MQCDNARRGLGCNNKRLVRYDWLESLLLHFTRGLNPTMLLPDAEERKAREERKRKKDSLIHQGLSEITSYLLRLRHEDIISSEEYWDSGFKKELTEAVRDALEDELSGEESAEEVRELVHETIDGELEIE